MGTIDIKKRNERARAQRMSRIKGIWCGPVQKKILLLLLGGIALSCARTPRNQWRIIRETHEGWKEISKQAAERAVAALYESKLVEAIQNADGTVTIVLSKDGKRRAQTQSLRFAKIHPRGPWDRKWRIILYDVPEDERDTRNAFRDHLTRLGFRKLQHSAAIYPFECKNEIDFFIELLDIRKYVRFIVADSIDDDTYWKRIFKLDGHI